MLKTHDGDQMGSELKNEIEEGKIQKNTGQEICQQYNVKNDKDDNNNDQLLGQVNTDSSVDYENRKLHQENTKLTENIECFRDICCPKYVFLTGFGLLGVIVNYSYPKLNICITMEQDLRVQIDYSLDFYIACDFHLQSCIL